VFVPGGVAAMDNLSSHKSARARALIEAAGAWVVFLPPYSPDMNPIEFIFAKVKQLHCSLGCGAGDALGYTMWSVPNQVTTTDAANSFGRCGHARHVE